MHVSLEQRLKSTQTQGGGGGGGGGRGEGLLSMTCDVSTPKYNLRSYLQHLFSADFLQTTVEHRAAKQR